ncbi:MAG: hypothetical protein RLZZ01_908 [Actinomycetota bacterium]
MIPDEMRAAVLREFGGPEVLRVEKIPVPVPGPGELLVRVAAVTVNQTLDIGVREGRRGTPALPHVLGVDPVGTVVALGPPDGSDLAPTIGDTVAVTASIWCGTCDHCRRGRVDDCAAVRHVGVHRHGGYAEFVAVPVRNAHCVPNTWDPVDTAVIVRHVPTAVNLLRRAELVDGETVLVMGAGGGLGVAGVQVARAEGARVIAVAGSTARLEAARRAGADHVLDRRDCDVAGAVAELTGGRGVDVVFDNTGNPATWSAVTASMARSGRLVVAGAHGGGRVELDLNLLYRSRLRLIGGGGHTVDDVRRAIDIAERGLAPAIVDTVMPLESVAEAHRRAEGSHGVGKVVISPLIDSAEFR